MSKGPQSFCDATVLMSTFNTEWWWWWWCD